MSLINDEYIMNHYELFNDEALEKPVKKKITIAFNDRKIYCQRKILDQKIEQK